MKVYKIRCLIDDYKQLNLDGFGLINQLGVDIDSNEVRDIVQIGTGHISFSGRWARIVTEFEALSHTNASKIPDVTSFGDALLVLSEQAYSQFRELLKEGGEFLPIIANNTPVYFFNSLCNGVVDERNSKYIGEGHGIEVEKIVFIEESIRSVPVFYNVHHGLGDLYCTEVFKALYDEVGFKGIDFVEV